MPWLSALFRRAGRRGLFLAFLALLDAVYGYSLLAAQPGTAAASYPLVPRQAWAAIWLAAGAVCASGVPARLDRWQYAAAATVKTAWAARYGYLWTRHVPLAWAGLAVWAAFAAAVLMVSGWPEAPPAVPALPPEGSLPGNEEPG